MNLEKTVVISKNDPRLASAHQKTGPDVSTSVRSDSEQRVRLGAETNDFAILPLQFPELNVPQLADRRRTKKTLSRTQPGIGLKLLASLAIWSASLGITTVNSAVGKENHPASGQRPKVIDSRGVGGSLILAGGGNLDQSIKDRFMELAGGPKAKLVVIPTASTTADTPDTDHGAAWRTFNPATLSVLHTRERSRANEPDFVQPLREATAVWISGGSQSRLADTYVGTAVEQELQALLARGGVIGGTSAGAAIMSQDMIANGKSSPNMGTGFDLLPGAIIDQHFVARKRQPRSLQAVKDHPGKFGLGIDEGTAVEVTGRQMRVMGNSTATITLGPSSNRPSRVFAVAANDIIDLTSLRRAAIARAGPEFPAVAANAPKVASGSLLIIGGGGVTENMVERFIRLAGGDQAHIVVLPTAVDDSVSRQAGIPSFLRDQEVKTIQVLPQRWPNEVNSPAFVEALEKATGVWFGGGRQWRFIDAYQGTKATDLFNGVLARGGIIAGSSAGASIQAEYMVRGDPLGNQVVMAEGYERGLGFLPGVAIDQHLTQRGRLDDLRSVVKRFPQLLGIGLDESTGILVAGSKAEVLGEHAVFFLDHSEAKESRLEEGQVYDLKLRQVITSKHE